MNYILTEEQYAAVLRLLQELPLKTSFNLYNSLSQVEKVEKDEEDG